MATLEQKRACFALTHVEGVQADSEKSDKKFRTQLLKLPARLHNNGLGQTAAYLRAQGSGSPEHEIFSWLEAWLHGEAGGVYPAGVPLLDAASGRAQAVQGREEQLYRRASVEARALAVWLKRFAEAFLSDTEETSEEGG